MYRVGFGDFFLVTFLNAGKPLHIVIDCGVFKGTKQSGDIGSIEAAVADMAKTTAGQLELIIMTHRHADHIAGFARCADTFKKMKVGAVWMSIWESEYEPTASKFQAELTRTAVGLQRHFTALGSGATEEQRILNDPGINTVVIATRHNLHARQVLAVIAAGKHIFCEKPLCLNEVELAEIV